jgi:hypothetical protein
MAEKSGPSSDDLEEVFFVGYDHASIIGCLRPDLAYPDRKIRAGKRLVTTITAEPCDCPDEHVKVFVSRPYGR